MAATRSDQRSPIGIGVFRHPTLGTWAVLGGFACAAAGAVLGPRHD